VNTNPSRRSVLGSLAALPFLYGIASATPALGETMARPSSTPQATGDQPFDRFLAVHFPAAELRILDLHGSANPLDGLTQILGVDQLIACGIVSGYSRRAPWFRRAGRCRLGAGLAGVFPASFLQICR